MAMMCEECKCSTYLNEDTGMYSCESGCPCCNDPEWESDWDIHLRIIKQVREYIYLHKLSLEQDMDKLFTFSGSAGVFNDLTFVQGEVQACQHILDYIDNIDYEGVK
jgi:hypothetical protein